MDFRVLKTSQFEDKLLVIYEWMKYPFIGPVRNLYAYDADGGRLWIAEVRRLGDFYIGFVNGGQQLQTTTRDGFYCTLDPESGKILKSKLMK